MSKNSSSAEVLRARPRVTDTDVLLLDDSRTSLPHESMSNVSLKDISGAMVIENQYTDPEITDMLRRGALRGAKEFKIPVGMAKTAEKAAALPESIPEKKENIGKSRLQKALGRLALFGKRTVKNARHPQDSEKTSNTPEVATQVREPFTAESMVPDAPMLEEVEIFSETRLGDIDLLDEPLTAEFMTPDAPVLKEVEIFHKNDLLKIHFPTEQEQTAVETDHMQQELPQVSQIAGSFWTDRRNMLRAKKVWTAAVLGATALATAGSAMFSHGVPVESLATTQLASTKAVEVPQYSDQAIAPLTATVTETPALAAVTGIPRAVSTSAPAAGVTIPAPAPAPIPAPVEKTPKPVQKPAKRHQNNGPVTTHAPKTQKPTPQPVEPTEAPGPNHVYVVTPGAGDPTADFAVSEYIRQGIIPPGAQIIRNTYSAIIAPGQTQNSIQEGTDGLKNILTSLPPGVRATSLGFSQGSMVNDRANSELTREGRKRDTKFRDDGAPDSPTGLMRSPQYEMFKPFVQGVLGLQPEELDPNAEVEMNVDSADVYGTNFDGEWRKIIKNFAGPQSGGLRNHRIIGANEKPVQIIRKGKVTERIFGDPQPVPADAQLIEGPYIAPEPNPLAPMPAGGDTSAILGPDGNPHPAPPAPDAPPVRDTLTGVPAVPAPAPVRSDVPSFFGEQPCPGGYFTPGDAPC